jgi:hypothetical protein
MVALADVWKLMPTFLMPFRSTSTEPDVKLSLGGKHERPRAFRRDPCRRGGGFRPHYRAGRTPCRLPANSRTRYGIRS